MTGEVLPDNTRMLKLARHFGFRLEPAREGVVRISLVIQDR